jgi:hypothetical protein
VGQSYYQYSISGQKDGAGRRGIKVMELEGFSSHKSVHVVEVDIVTTFERHLGTKERVFSLSM